MPPAALFLQQAGLATPSTSIPPTRDTTPKRQKLSITDLEDANNQEASNPTIINNIPEPRPRRALRFRSAVKRFLPKFSSEKSTIKHTTEDPKAVATSSLVSPFNSGSQPLPHDFAFKWPGDTPVMQNTPVQNTDTWDFSNSFPALQDSPAPYSGQSYTLSTDVSPWPISSAIGRVPLPTSAQPMTGSTDYSSRVVSPYPLSSNIGRVPLPASALPMTGSTDFHSPVPFSPQLYTSSPAVSSDWPVSSTIDRIPLPASALPMTGSTGFYSPRSA